MTRVAINGFGRIGRMVFRKCVNDKDIEVAAINASYPAETLAHLIKYDTVHGTFDKSVTAEDGALLVDGRRIELCSSRDPEQLPWKELNIDIVVEATGKFTSKEDASLHLKAGAQKVVITAPGKNEDVTLVYGVNEEIYDPESHHIISNASCTTNCLAPVAKVLHDTFTVQSGVMTTVHSYTNDQKNIDNPHKDLRRARACGQSIIPTTTGAAKAIGKVLPDLKGKLHGMALRVPTPNVSLVDLVVNIEEETSAEEVNAVLRHAASQSMKGIIEYTDEPLVSTDFNGNAHSSIIDGLSTMVVDGRQIKVLAWYDNEWGYSCRVVDLVKYAAERLPVKTEVHAS
ncbi:glyceraldehyde-3-phosphate dehydrogenase [Salipaludibacillus sp. CUR1]|uniref:glyceraldehyde-3-phosphate dehydrogenase n=1 Tax=Salipaludibacillus sp. CUR1 TaxID=2820003 RepID=UPI001E4664E1|nr:glyceraldehyde-3-phosphate dehydrogenase [Salipaludibacillus sp. CUR1]MCE7793381.1 glyceraldehyde-3-phosphate dehydrogenase [Salipaludibacillus sp. CUR1]